MAAAADRVICQILLEVLGEMVVAVQAKTYVILRNQQWLDQ